MPQSLLRSTAITLCFLLAAGSTWAQTLEPGQTVEVFVHGNWGTVGRVKRVDASGVLVIYRAEDGTYNESTGFARYFPATEVRLQSSAAAAPKAAGKYKVGDRVEGWNIAWYKGTVVKVGVEGYAGYYLVKHDEYAQDSYYKDANVRRLADSAPRPAAPRAATPAAPLLGTGGGLESGTYGCGVYLSGRYTPTQTITLEGGRYATTHGEGGRYTFDATTGRVEFQGGALADQVGQHEPDNKRIIRLIQRKDLGASGYAQKWRSQVCSPR